MSHILIPFMQQIFASLSNEEVLSLLNLNREQLLQSISIVDNPKELGSEVRFGNNRSFFIRLGGDRLSIKDIGQACRINDKDQLHNIALHLIEETDTEEE